MEAAIDRLYLLVVPHVEVKYDAEKEEKSHQEAKQADLKRIEEAKKKAAMQGIISLNISSSYLLNY